MIYFFLNIVEISLIDYASSKFSISKSIALISYSASISELEVIDLHAIRIIFLYRNTTQTDH